MVTSATSRDANQEPQGCDLDFTNVSSLASGVEQVDHRTAMLSMGDTASCYSHSFTYFSSVTRNITKSEIPSISMNVAIRTC